jgi:predicted transcriptional regulator
LKKVRDIMTKNVVKSDKDSTIYDLARLMDQNRIGCIVIAEDDKPIGIVTERDIITKCLAKEMNPREYSGPSRIRTGDHRRVRAVS